MTELNTIWKDKSITLQLKIKLGKCLTWTVRTYGTEGRTLKTKQIKKTQSAEMWFYRRMLRVIWREKRTNESILKELGTKRELATLSKRESYHSSGMHAEVKLMFPHERHNARKSRRKKWKGKTSNAIYQ